MGASESSLSVAATLMVSDRRKQLSEAQLDYISTDEIKIFYSKYGDRIKKRACDIYGFELIKLIGKKRVSLLSPIIDEIHKYRCKDYRSPQIYEAITMMFESQNTAYQDYFSKLVGYITFDSIIDSVIAGNRNLYDRLKEPVARIPGREGLLDPLRAAENRGRVLTLTDMNKEELGSFAIFIAFIMMSVYPTSTTQLYFLQDIVEYVQQIGFLSKREAYNLFNNLADLMENGDLYLWSPKLIRETQYMQEFNPPPASVETQKEAYQKSVKDVRERYPTIGIIEQYYK